MFAPAVIVHSLEMALQAVSAAHATRRPVTLLSAEAAACFAGVGWWRALVAAADPDRICADILDCGPAPGRALEALRVGQRLLVLRAEPRIWADIAGRAAACGGMLLAEAPQSLDLGVPGAARLLADWLG